jgi:hypothetical protein
MKNPEPFTDFKTVKKVAKQFSTNKVKSWAGVYPIIAILCA